MVTGPQLSETVGVPSVTFVAPHRPGEASTVTRAGQEIVGGCVSLTITVCGQVTLLPWLSITVQFTVLVPTGKSAGALFVIDRKSTRLNSSHRCISYAVFCLKKKK